MKFLVSNLKLLATRFRAVTLINIIGLAVAFAVAAVVAIQSWYDLSYDRGYENSDEIFVAEMKFDAQPERGVWVNLNQQIPAVFKDVIPEIRAYAQSNGENTVTFRREGVSEDSPGYNISSSQVSPGYLDVFTPVIIAGDALTALSTPNNAIISRKSAETIFGTENPIGQTLTSFGSEPVTIGAVYEDFPKNSTAINGLLTYMPPNRPNNWNYWTWFRLDPAECGNVMEKMQNVEVGEGDDTSSASEDGVSFHLHGIARYHLRGGVPAVGSSKGTLGNTLYLLIMGALVIAISFINFVNLFMSMAPARVRKINTFRILGSGKAALRMSLALESAITLVVAMALGVGLMSWFSSSVFTEFFSADISPTANVGVIVLLALALVVAAFVVALYPASYATSFDVAVALKGSMVLAPRGVMLRNALITLQFAVAIFFICFSVFIRVQYDYMQRYSVGYEKENIVIVPLLPDSLSRASFSQELRRNPDVVDVSWSAHPGRLGTRWGRDFEGKTVQVALWSTDFNTLDFLGVEILAGNDFSPEIKGRDQVIVNRKFLDTYDFTAEDVIGKGFFTYRDGTIVGVVGDVNFESLHNEVRPMVFVAMNDWNTQGLVKIAGGDTPATLRQIEDVWNRFKPAGMDFSLEFLDDKLDAQYKTELNMSRLMGIMGLIAVITAVMGVYVIILFNSRYKTREIAIRKVNGATISRIIVQLNRGILIALGVATALALAPTLWFVRGWVSSFAYKAGFPWWLYPAAVVLVLLIAVATVSWQSYRAASANPVESLKSE